MSLRERLYGAAAAAARALSPVIGLLRPSLSAQVAERRAAAAALEEWARGGAGGPEWGLASSADGPASGRRRAKTGADPWPVPLLWVHGASAGELLGVAPAIEAVRRQRPLRLVVTHFSPSGGAAAAALSPGWHGYPPFDAPGDCRRAVAALSPAALVYAKGDVWPGLTAAAGRAGVRLGLVNATVGPESSRLRGPARWLLQPAHRRLDRVGAASEEDAGRLRRLGVREGALRMTGDGAFDRALERVRPALEAVRTFDRSPSTRSGDGPGDTGNGPVLVAGSTWPEDEGALLAAAAALERRGVFLRLVLVPHQPGPQAVRALAHACRGRLGRDPIRWSASQAASGGEEAGPAPVRLLRLLGEAPDPAPPIVVDAVGLLQDLYAAADLAYVGGGFGTDGLHSVVEPAAAGVPVLFGPRAERREARDLVTVGAAEVVERASLADALERLCQDEERRRTMGGAARAYVKSGAGAAEATAALILELLDGAEAASG